MHLRITHNTTCHYSPAVETAQHMAHLQPCDSPCQTVIDHTLQVSPEPETRSRRTDAFGNPQSHWSLSQAHKTLQVIATSDVHTRALPSATCTQPWEAVRDLYRYQGERAAPAAGQFVFGSHHAPHHEAFAAFARDAFAPGRPLMDAATALMDKMHTQLRYESHSTDIHTPALEALQAGRGVCQDFAHILIACLRSLGLAARYVSGYLLTQPPEGQPRLIGADASHAWASVYLPSLAEHPCQGWLDLDPTNKRCGLASPGPDYVRLAVGRDFADVSPLRGVLQGGASHSLEVGVTVEPLLTPEEAADERLRHPEIPAH